MKRLFFALAALFSIECIGGSKDEIVDAGIKIAPFTVKCERSPTLYDLQHFLESNYIPWSLSYNRSPKDQEESMKDIRKKISYPNFHLNGLKTRLFGKDVTFDVDTTMYKDASSQKISATMRLSNVKTLFNLVVESRCTFDVAIIGNEILVSPEIKAKGANFLGAPTLRKKTMEYLNSHYVDYFKSEAQKFFSNSSPEK